MYQYLQMVARGVISRYPSLHVFREDLIHDGWFKLRDLEADPNLGTLEAYAYKHVFGHMRDRGFQYLSAVSRGPRRRPVETTELITELVEENGEVDDSLEGKVDSRRILGTLNHALKSNKFLGLHVEGLAEIASIPEQAKREKCSQAQIIKLRHRGRNSLKRWRWKNDL